MQRWEELTLDNFNGPLDLLLHMIKEKDVDIMDVNLLELSNQYIEYIKKWENLDVEIASEYLGTAAYLIELKSKLLIPKEKVEIDDNYEERQQDELLKRLVEYHRIKEMTNYFKEKQMDFLLSYSKPKSVVKVTKVDDDTLPLAENTIDIDKFSKIFLKVMERQKFKEPVINTIRATELSPEEVAVEIIELFAKYDKKWWTLEELLQEKGYTIPMMVAIFLAILDLAKNQKVTISQLSDDIKIEKFKEIKE